MTQRQCDRDSASVARVHLATGLMLLLAVCAYVCNSVITGIDVVSGCWNPKPIAGLPIGQAMVGMDGIRLVQHTRELVRDRSWVTRVAGYPEGSMASPFIFVLCLPLCPLSDLTAIIILMMLSSVALALAIMISAWLSCVAAREEWHACGSTTGAALAGALVAIFMCFTSYSYFFAMERANWHGLETLCSVTSVALLLVRRRWQLLQLLMLSCAVHFKIYPIVLLPLFVLVQGLKVIPVFALCYIPLCFCWGYDNALAYVSKVAEFSARASAGPWAHDARTFALWLVQERGYNQTLCWAIAAGLPLLMWALGLLMTWFSGATARRILLMYVITVAVMSTMQTLSWDYKLVIVYPSLALLLTMTAQDYGRHARWADLLLIVMLMVLMAFIARNQSFIQIFMLRNKYPFIVLMQMIAFYKLMTSPARTQTDHSTGNVNVDIVAA